uniref:Putative ovule protein n=1 Tax=Solanum chacoense TaxID=4108 RepID=A0A0V0INX0_SOLCH
MTRDHRKKTKTIPFSMFSDQTPPFSSNYSLTRKSPPHPHTVLPPFRTRPSSHQITSTTVPPPPSPAFHLRNQPKTPK